MTYLKQNRRFRIGKSCLLCRTGATWDKQHGVDVERQRLLAQTRDLVNKGLQADHLWHTATHADYARPMLQVLLLIQSSIRPCIRLSDHSLAYLSVHQTHVSSTGNARTFLEGTTMESCHEAADIQLNIDIVS